MLIHVIDIQGKIAYSPASYPAYAMLPHLRRAVALGKKSQRLRDEETQRLTSLLTRIGRTREPAVTAQERQKTRDRAEALRKYMREQEA